MGYRIEADDDRGENARGSAVGEKAAACQNKNRTRKEMNPAPRRKGQDEPAASVS